MKLLDALLGRTKPVRANLDALFGLPGAVVTLQASEALVPTGQAGVCYKAAAGQPFARSADEFRQLLGVTGGDASATTVRQQTDEYGYTWLVLETSDFETLVTQVHVVNSTLKDDGFDQMLLCSVFGFRPEASAGAAASIYLVYLYKRGSFYPFVPMAESASAAGAPQRRDAETELKLQYVLADDLGIESDKQRWMPLWGLPVH